MRAGRSLSLLLLLLLAAAGCGEQAEETAEPESTEAVEEAEEGVVTAVYPTIPEDYLYEQGIRITPQGEFSLLLTGFDGDTGEDAGSFTASGNCTITEETAEGGMKRVVFRMELDLSACGGSAARYEVSALDRTTGSSLEGETEILRQEYKAEGSSGSLLDVDTGEGSFTASLSYSTENTWPVITDTLILTCPPDYDGCVFFIGPSADADPSEILYFSYMDR